MFVFPRRLDQLSRFHRWVDLALLFKKSVGREIAVLEVADSVFSHVQHSRNPVLKFCGQRTAGDLSQSTILRPELFPGGSSRLCSLEENATLLQLCGARWRKLRLARQCGSQEKQRVQANGSNLQVLLNKVRTLGCKISLKRQTQGRLEGDRWVEGEVLYSRSTTTRLQLQCSCFFRCYAVRWRGYMYSGLAGRRTRRFTVADLRRHTFFLLNECSLSQNECLWPLQTNFYRTFGRFVSALIITYWFLVRFSSNFQEKLLMPSSYPNFLFVWLFFSLRPEFRFLCTFSRST